MYRQVKGSEEVRIHGQTLLLSFIKSCKRGLICLRITINLQPLTFNSAHDHTPFAEVARVDRVNENGKDLLNSEGAQEVNSVVYPGQLVLLNYGLSVSMTSLKVLYNGHSWHSSAAAKE